MSKTKSVAAIDLGATSGRVVRGVVSEHRAELEVVSRFSNGGSQTDAGLFWDVTRLYGDALAGLKNLLVQDSDIASIGVDSWAVDYARMASGALVAEPFHYRDARNRDGVEAAHALVSPEELYKRNGLQFLPFNTLYQLVAERSVGGLQDVDSILLIPDLFNYWLTGVEACERTNASTTGLLDVATREWDQDLLVRLGLPPTLLAQLVDAGSLVGKTTLETGARLGVTWEIPVVAVGSHDTASAVVAIPMDPSCSAYISCGTWGLVGVELEAPVLSEASRQANFTNEGGVDGRVRFLHNVMGLWLLSESIRDWESDGERVDLDRLLAEASELERCTDTIDVNDQRFLPANDMVARIAEQCVVQDIAVPTGRAGYARLILDSLAEAFARAIRTASDLSGLPISRVHLVGGGSLNTLLCQETSNRLGLELLAGPVEATALGNVLIQARAVGACSGDLENLRAIVTNSVTPRLYRPDAYIAVD